MTDLDARLDAATQQPRTELSRADNKAVALVSAFAVPVAVLAAVVPGRHLPPTAGILIGLGSIGLVAAMLILLLCVVMPWIKGAPRGTYLYWATCTPAELVEDLQTDTRAEDVIRLSQLARRKYAAVRLSIFVTASALTVLALGVLAA
ncbi:Pycsar system effector family protein [Streptomyces sp. CA2R101]|uniref:Pycsar system effector family protein n=1 Tax=Streptomyces sp. CA2R101 TaxID=3120152 RepID=UPI00300AAF4B